MNINQLKALVEQADTIHNACFVEFSDRQDEILRQAFAFAENEQWKRINCEPYLSMMHSTVQTYEIQRSRGRV